MDQALLDEAVGELRALVALDGGDVELVSANEGTVALRLILEGAECRECVMPKEFLEQIALDMVTTRLTEVNTVTIDDPRE
ncbi:MAG: NifU family protein [Acidimicrobiia bacterium]|nr:NifU family protein [Acidimicrobiia bacterium]MYG57945.1 NifU family protein [Acidimicrobiia bacterium]MYJ33063.1 NifU family protein [Acidimicrobiia bacterium]